MIKVTASKLRANIYQLLDSVAITGESIAVERHGMILTINPPTRHSKLAQLKRRKGLNAKPDELVNLKWDKAWQSKPL